MTERYTKTMTAIIALKVLTLGSAVTTASAGDLGFYMGASYGVTSREGIEQAPFDALSTEVYNSFGFAPTLATFVSLDDGDEQGFNITGGYRLTRYLAVEGGYTQYGKVRYQNNSDGLFFFFDSEGEVQQQAQSWSQSLKTRVKGFALSALGVLPLNYWWEFYGRGGVLLTTNELSWYVTNGVGDAGDSQSESSADVFAGVGVSMTFAEVYGARLEFQRLFGADGVYGAGAGDIDYLSLGFTVQF